MRVKYKDLYLIFVVLFTAITAGIDLYTYHTLYYGDTYIQRQYGNEIKFNFLSIMLIIGVVVILRKKQKRIQKNLFFYLFVFSLLSILFPNGQDRILTCLAIIKITKYYLFFVCFVNMYDFDQFDKALKKSLIIIIWVETICGLLQEFFGIYIPFISSRNVIAYRNGFLRMPGTFSYAADFALFISAVMMYFVVELLINNDKKMLKYVIMCLIDLWFAGSRTMIVISAIAVAIIFWRRNKGKILARVLIVFIGLIGVFLFVRSSTFREMFIENDVLLMLSTRMVHWQLSLNMFVQNIYTGVGLNNSVNYAIAHPDIVKAAYIRSLEGISFYYTNPAHNSIFVMASELGIIGGVLYAGMYIRMIICLLKNYKKNHFRKGVLYIGASGLVLMVYAFQGWGSLREFGWMLLVLSYSYFYLLNERIKKDRLHLTERK